MPARNCPIDCLLLIGCCQTINAYQVFFHCLFFKKRQWAEQFLAGTYESCYAFWPFKNCGILIFFKGYLLTFWINFRWEGTKEAWILWSFCGVMRFSGENCSSAGALSKQGFLTCSSIIRSSKRRTQNPSKSLKKNMFEAKGRWYTTGKVIQRLSNIDLYTYLAIYHYRWSKQ